MGLRYRVKGNNTEITEGGARGDYCVIFRSRGIFTIIVFLQKVDRLPFNNTIPLF